MANNIANIYDNAFTESASMSHQSTGGDMIYGPIYSAGSRESTDAFNQIAPRPRLTQNFDRVLKAEIHDPLFMLARQWQMGEFEFEDTGSAIYAKIAMDLSKLSRLKTNGAVETYSDEMPLETRIERQEVKYSLKERVRLGEQWLKMLKAGGVDYDATSPPTPFDFGAYKTFFLDDYSFEKVPEIEVTDTDTAVIVSKAKRLTQIKEVQYLNLISGRKVDGVMVYEALKTDPTIFNNALGGTTIYPFIGSTVATDPTVAKAFIAWVEDIYSIPNDPVTDNCWNPESFAYDAEISSPRVDSSGTPIKNRVLSAKDYSSDKLDWYAFNERPALTGTDPMADIDTSESVEPTETITMIPTAGDFPGMPATRWWEFEEGRVNIAGSDLSATDTVKSVLAEFALVYQDDWFVVPKLLPVGATAKVTGIVVKDVFGQHTLVQHTSESPGIESNWESWDMYSQTEANVGEGIDPTDDSLFLAPSTHDIMLSEPLEEIVFIRDEMANMVFAIEKKIWNNLGEGIDAAEAAGTLKQFLLDRSPETLPVTEDAELRYELGNTIPINWIPFIPVHVGPGNNRAIKLQRASMPLILSDYEQVPIRPRTEFLRSGINEDDSLQTDPKYFIHDEIVPRAGIKLQKKLQRTRWFNGKTYLWLSHSKTIGHGQGNSNLQFDRVLDTQKA